MPQGSPKKIQIDLLLADLALQRGDPPLRPRQLVLARLARLTCRRARHRRCSLTRAAQPAQRRRSTLANLVPPRIQKPAPKLQSPRNRGDALPCRQARQRGLLQCRRILPVPSSVPLLEKLSPIFRVSLLGCTTHRIWVTIVRNDNPEQW